MVLGIDTLKKRVDKCTLPSQSVATSKLGITKVSASCGGRFGVIRTFLLGISGLHSCQGFFSPTRALLLSQRRGRSSLGGNPIHPLPLVFSICESQSPLLQVVERLLFIYAKVNQGIGYVQVIGMSTKDICIPVYSCLSRLNQIYSTYASWQEIF